MVIQSDSIIFSYEAFPGVKRTVLDNPAQYIIDEILNTNAINIRMTVFDAKLQTILVFKFSAGQWHESCNRVYSNIAS